jgi:hypothetical protein
MRTLVAVAAVLRRFRAERRIAGLLFILVVTTSLVVANRLRPRRAQQAHASVE